MTLKQFCQVIKNEYRKHGTFVDVTQLVAKNTYFWAAI